MKLTVEVSPALYRAVREGAARDGRSVGDVVTELLEAWVDQRATEWDVSTASAALDEYSREGGSDAVSFFNRLNRDR
jgi:hypothetical protein